MAQGLGAARRALRTVTHRPMMLELESHPSLRLNAASVEEVKLIAFCNGDSNPILSEDLSGKASLKGHGPSWCKQVRAYFENTWALTDTLFRFGASNTLAFDRSRTADRLQHIAYRGAQHCGDAARCTRECSAHRATATVACSRKARVWLAVQVVACMLDGVCCSGLKNDSCFYMIPDKLRRPLIFYYAHPAALYVNKMKLAGLVADVDPFLQVVTRRMQ
jgi:hypothetical protein